MSSSFEYLLSTEFKQNLYLQKNFVQMEPFFENLSYYMSPAIILSVWIPLVGALDTELLIDLMLLVPTATFASTLLKWVIPEPRPYWWVQETQLFTPKTRPKLNILPCTCETTSGSFSTHSMVFTVFVLVIGMKLFSMYKERNMCADLNRLKYGIYGLAVLVSTTMWMSRMYVATHFLHQCIAGTILGLAIVYYYYENYDFQDEVTDTKQKDALLFVLACSAVVALIYGAMVGLDFDLQWPVRLAFKWCGKPEYLNPNTTPVYSIVKDLAVLFGVAAASPLMEKRDQTPNLYLSTPIAVCIVAANRALETNTPTALGRCAFLTYVFVQNFLFSYAVTHVAPKHTGEKCEMN